MMCRRRKEVETPRSQGIEWVPIDIRVSRLIPMMAKHVFSGASVSGSH